jgi:hypothetical protein
MNCRPGTGELDEPMNLAILKQLRNVTQLVIEVCDLSQSPDFMEAFSCGEVFPNVQALWLRRGAIFGDFEEFLDFVLNVPSNVQYLAVHESRKINEDGREVYFDPSTDKVFEVCKSRLEWPTSADLRS